MATPLSDDPAQLKLLVQLREAEGRAKDLELRMNARELAATEEKLETAESRLRERDARVAVPGCGRRRGWTSESGRASMSGCRWWSTWPTGP